jgi:hypothetical protein
LEHTQQVIANKEHTKNLLKRIKNNPTDARWAKMESMIDGTSNGIIDSNKVLANTFNTIVDNGVKSSNVQGGSTVVNNNDGSVSDPSINDLITGNWG